MLNKLMFLCLSILLALRCNAEKLIIDTDGGGDDAIAILMLLKAESLKDLRFPQFEIIGITCTYGNTEEENVELNVLRILTVTNRSDIPVYKGAKKPLIGNFSSTYYYGKNGFGDVEFDQEIKIEINKSMQASIALNELTKRHKGNVSILVLGPTTNVALAASLDENFIRRVNRFYVMGSSVAGVGNFRPNVEFNFAADPVSNFILLNSTTSSQLTLFPWEAGLNANLPKKWRTNVLGKYKSPYINFLNKIEKFSLSKPGTTYTIADAMTVATMLWPDIIKTTLETNVEAVYDGAAKGSVLVDYSREIGLRPANARIIQTIDVEQFKESLVYYLTCEEVRC